MFFIISKTKPATELAQSETRAAARAQAKTLGGTVKTAAEWAKVQDPVAHVAAKNARYPSQASADATKAARKALKADREEKRAVNKKVRAAKPAPKKQEPRVETSPAVLAKGAAALEAAVAASLNKVGVVRAVAAVSGLQRRDVFALILAEKRLGIAPATIATQYQKARSEARAA